MKKYNILIALVVAVAFSPVANGKTCAEAKKEILGGFVEFDRTASDAKIVDSSCKYEDISKEYYKSYLCGDIRITIEGKDRIEVKKYHKDLATTAASISRVNLSYSGDNCEVVESNIETESSDSDGYCEDLGKALNEKMGLPFSIGKSGSLINSSDKKGFFSKTDADGMPGYECNTSCSQKKIKFSKDEKGRLSEVFITRNDGSLMELDLSYRDGKCVLEKIKQDRDTVFDLGFCRDWNKFKDDNNGMFVECYKYRKAAKERFCDQVKELKNQNQSLSIDNMMGAGDYYCKEDIEDEGWILRYEHYCRSFLGTDLTLREVSDQGLKSYKVYSKVKEEKDRKEKEAKSKYKKEQREWDREMLKQEIEAECGEGGVGIKVDRSVWSGKESCKEVKTATQTKTSADGTVTITAASVEKKCKQSDDMREDGFVSCRGSVSYSEYKYITKFCHGQSGYYDDVQQQVYCTPYNYVAPTIKTIQLPPSMFGIGGLNVGGWL